MGEIWLVEVVLEVKGERKREICMVERNKLEKENSA
jgi:hypothetical protein